MILWKNVTIWEPWPWIPGGIIQPIKLGAGASPKKYEPLKLTNDIVDFETEGTPSIVMNYHLRSRKTTNSKVGILVISRRVAMGWE